MFDDRIGNLQKMLARMGPEGRQRYAADHADDPIAVSMALFVNNIAKEIKEGKRGEPDMPPPVVQQAIQSMTQPKMPQGGPPQGMPPQGPPQGMPPQGMPPQGMPPQGMPPQGMPPQGPPQMAADGGYMDSRMPEEMGIGALPERSLSNMADGGIVGFADGGDVQRFQSGGTPKPRPMYPGMIRQEGEGLLPNTTGYENMGILEFIQKFGVDAYNKIKNTIPGETTEERRARLKQEVFDATLTGQRDKAMAVVNAPAPIDSMSFPPRVLGPYSQTGVLPNQAVSGGAEDPDGAGPPRPAPPRPAPAPAAGAGAGASAARSASPAAGSGAGATNVSTGPGLPSLASQFNSIDVSGLSPAQILESRTAFEKGIAAIDPVATERAALNAKAKMFSEQALTDFEKEVKDRGDPYAKREERANKQEASIAESAERNPYLSLMEAGFAMMAGDSPYAMVNIGKGALVGTKAYKEGLDKIEKAKEKLSEVRDKIEDYRINRDDLTAKERRAFKTDIRNTELEGDKNIIAGLALASGRKDAEVRDAMKAYHDSYNNAATNRTKVAIANLEQTGQGQRTMYTTDAQVRMSNADRTARANEANANRLMQKEIAGMPGATQQLIEKLGKGDIEKGYRIYKENPKQDDALFLDWAKRSEDPYTGEEFRKRYPTSQVYIEAARKNGTGVVDVDAPLRTR